MKSREMTILAIALGAWGAWRVVGSHLLPVGSEVIGIAIIVLFKPWLDFRGWMTLLTVNAMSYIHAWYWSWVTVSSFMNDRFLEAMRLSGLLSEDTLTNVPGPTVILLMVVINFIYTYFIWPYIWERVYLKAGVWGKLKWEK